MNTNQRVKRYICGFPQKKRLIVLALLIIAVGCAVFSALKSAEPEPIPMKKDTEDPAWVYLDTVGVSSWIAEKHYTLNGYPRTYRYYLALDAEDESVYLIRLPDDYYNLLRQDLNTYYLYGGEKPESLRLKGELRSLQAEDRKQLIESLGTDEATFDQSFQNRFLFVGAAYSSAPTVFAFLAALAFAIPAVILLAKGIRRSKCENTALRRLEAKELLEPAAEDLGLDFAEPVLGDRLRLGSRFLFGEEIGLAAPWEEVYWCYEKKMSIYFLTFRFFMIGTADGLLHALPIRKQEEGRLRELMDIFQSRNPDILLGYDWVNRQKYNARCGMV